MFQTASILLPSSSDQFFNAPLQRTEMFIFVLTFVCLIRLILQETRLRVHYLVYFDSLSVISVSCEGCETLISNFAINLSFLRRNLKTDHNGASVKLCQQLWQRQHTQDLTKFLQNMWEAMVYTN